MFDIAEFWVSDFESIKLCQKFDLNFSRNFSTFLHIKMLKMVTKISWNKNWKKLWNIWKIFLQWSGDFWQLKMLAMNSERSNFLIKVFTSLYKLKWKKFLTSEVQARDFFLIISLVLSIFNQKLTSKWHF